MGTYTGTGGDDTITPYSVSSGVTASPPGTRPGAGDDTIYGGAGDDVLSGDQNGWIDDIGFDLIYGGDGSDRILDADEAHGGDGDDEIFSWGGGDVLYGDDGNDILHGSSGIEEFNVTLYGGDGDDVLYGGTTDTLYGGAGDDTYWVAEGEPDPYFGYPSETQAIEDTDDPSGGYDTAYTYFNATAGFGIEALILLEPFWGPTPPTNFTIRGNDLDNLIVGNSHDNRLAGLEGNDLLQGNGGGDMLDGGQGTDRLDGGGGNDRLEGNRGRDKLEGGKGKDDFVYTSVRDSGPSGDGRDRIEDFRDKDQIILKKVDADTTEKGNQAFDLDAGGSFDAGEIRMKDTKAGVLLQMNTDHDARVEMSILLSSFNGRINDADFVF